MLEDWESEQYELDQERADPYNSMMFGDAMRFEDLQVQADMDAGEGRPDVSDDLRWDIEDAIGGLVDSDEQRSDIAKAVVDMLVARGVVKI